MQTTLDSEVCLVKFTTAADTTHESIASAGTPFFEQSPHKI